jgi:hypothetical protein
VKDLQTLRGGVVIPFLQALVTGALVGLLSFVLGGNGLAMGAGVFLLTWIILVLRWLDLITWTVKPPEPEPAPQPEPLSLRIAVSQDNGHNVALAELKGFTLDQLAQLAQGLQAGATFSEAAWTGSGRPFTRPQFYELRQVFLSRGWAAWRSPGTPARGVVLTHPGEAVTRYFSSVGTPLLTQGDPKKPQ